MASSFMLFVHSSLIWNSELRFSTMKKLPHFLLIVSLWIISDSVFLDSASAQTTSTPPPVPNRWRGALADYDSEPRLPNGRVDVDTLVARLKELGVTTYYYLVWHAATDWDDLKLFLPKAAEAGLDVWVYLVPPSESKPIAKLSSEPFGMDYQRWAEEIAKLSLEHKNLTGWVIDDFHANHKFYTPDYVREMQVKAKTINPKLRFYPLMYFREIRRDFIEQYREVIDGVVVAYPEDREEIDSAWGLLNDALVTQPGEISYPWGQPSKAGDFFMASQQAKVGAGDKLMIHFQEKDDFTAPTMGYHFKQLLVNDEVAWEDDIGGGEKGAKEVTVDLTSLVKGKSEITLAFRILEKKGVSNFGFRWQVRNLRTEGLTLAADISEPEKWQVTQKGAFETGFGPATKKPAHNFHIPFIVMTSGQASEFLMRHGTPASPERMAEWVSMCLDAWRDGKCDGVVTYCLDKRPGSRVFDLSRDLFRGAAK